MYLLSVSYLFDEFDPAVDDAINLQVGKRSSASGAGFGERDLEFDFEDRDEAVAAANRITTHVPGATCLITANTPEHRLLEQILFDEMDALNSETFMRGEEVAIECAICGAPIVATMTVRVVPDGQGILMITDFSPAQAVWACQGGHPHDTAAMLERYRDFNPFVPWEDEPYVGESVHDWEGPTVVCVLGPGIDADRDARIMTAVGEELAAYRRAREHLTSLTFILPDRPHALAARVRVREADPDLRVTLNVAPDGVSVLDLVGLTERNPG